MNNETFEVDEISTVLNLHKNGRLSRRLVLRLVFLGLISTASFLIMVYDMIFVGLPFTFGFFGAMIGFTLGLFLFSRIFTQKWDEKKETIITGRIDIWSTVLFVFYWSSRFITQNILEHTYHNARIVSGLTFAIVFGLTLGRLSGVLSSIHKMNKEKNAK